MWTSGSPNRNTGNAYEESCVGGRNVCMFHRASSEFNVVNVKGQVLGADHSLPCQGQQAGGGHCEHDGGSRYQICTCSSM